MAITELKTNQDVSLEKKITLSANKEQLKVILDGLKRGILTDKSISFLNNNTEDKETLLNDFLEAAREGLADCLGVGMGTIEGARSFIKKVTDTFNIENKVLCSNDVLKKVKERLCDYIRQGDLYDAKKLVRFAKNNFEVKSKDLYSNKVLEAARKGLAYLLSKDKISDAKGLIQFVKDELKVDVEKLGSDEEVIDVAKEKLDYYLDRGKVSDAKDLILFVKDELNVDINELYSGKRVIRAAKHWFVYYLNRGKVSDAKDLILFVKDELNVGVEKLGSDEEVIDVAKEALVYYLERGKVSGAKDLILFVKDELKVDINNLYSGKRVIRAAKLAFVHLLIHDEISDAKEYIQFVKDELKVDIKSDKMVREQVKIVLRNHFDACDISCIKNIIPYVKDELKVNIKKLCSDEWVFERVKKEFVHLLFNDKISDAKGLIQLVKDELKLNVYIEKLSSDNEVLDVAKDKLDYYLCWGVRLGEVSDTKDLIQLVKDELGINSESLCSTARVVRLYGDLTSYVRQNHENAQLQFNIMKDLLGDKIKITDEHLELIKDKNYIDLYSIQKALEDGVGLDNKKEFLKYLLDYGEVWQDVPQIQDPFNAGVKYFGVNSMFEYIDENKTTLHDKMISFENICGLCKKFGKTEEIRKGFYNNILKQVKDDGSQYGEGASYHHLNAVARNLKDTSITDILEQAKKLQETLPDIEELVNYFSDDTSMVIASWKNLKKFMKLKELVDNKKTVEELAKIKKNDEQLYNYAKVLLFHKDSNVNVGAVKEFLYEPEKFFKRNDANSDEEVHNAIKPSNFYEHGLSAKDLQRAIVSGVLDGVQEIRPMEIEYEVRERTVLEYLEYAIGNGTKNKKGQVSKRGELIEKLFETFDEKSKKTNLSLFNYADIKLDEETLKKLKNRKIIKLEKGLTTEGKIIELKKELTYEEKIANRKKRILLDKILNGDIKLNKEQEEKIMEVLKTDTEMQKIFLDETSVYRAQIHRKSDPVATLVGDDTACCMPFGSGKGNIYYFTPNNAIFSIQKKIDDGFRTIAQSVMTLDVDTGINVEELKDISQIPSEKLIEKLVLTCDNVEVARNFQDDDNVTIIEDIYRCFFGSYLKEYADSISVEDGRVIIGKGYSDALKNLPSTKNTFIPTSLLGYSDNRGADSCILDLNQGNSTKLSFNETRRVSSEKHKREKSGEYTIENICLSDILKISRLENDVYGESLKEGTTEVQNTITSYLIKNALLKKEGFAYKIVDKGGELLSYIIATENTYGDVKEVYIADFASRISEGFTNGRMISEFFKRYRRQYEDNKILPVIAADFREKTSYKFIEDVEKLNKILSHYGFKAKVVEHDTEERGNETFHNCSIYIIKSDEDDSRFDEIIKAHNSAKKSFGNQN